MIRIKKPKQAPAILKNRGREATRQLCKRYDASHEAYKIDCRELLARQVEENPSLESSRRLALVDERLDWYAETYRSDSAEYAAMIRAALRARDRR